MEVVFLFKCNHGKQRIDVKKMCELTKVKLRSNGFPPFSRIPSQKTFIEITLNVKKKLIARRYALMCSDWLEAVQDNSL